MNPKNKGSSFERLISKECDVWWGEVPGTFWRTKISGGSDEPGDIAPRYRPQHASIVWWPFIIECKHYKSINILNLFRTEKHKENHLLKWWKQSTKEQKEAIKLGYTSSILRLVIFKINTYPILCMFSPEEFQNKSKENINFINSFTTQLLIDRKNQEVFVITRFEDFKEFFTKEKLERLFK
jgi:hypothetical protein